MAMFRLETLIIDEADRMLDVGFRPQIQRIARACGTKRQTALYTATLTKGLRELAQSILQDPVNIGLAEPDTIPETIQHNLVFCDSHEHKLEVLDLMLTKSNMRQALVFVTTQKAVEELIEHVTVQGHVAVPAHGGMTTAERSASVNIFRRRKAQLLVATDVAARGMDIPGLRDVIMLNLPIHAEDYVHRIGRVGRAGKPGWAWALVSDADKRRLEKIEKLLGRTLPSRAIPSLIAEEHREPRQDDDDLVRARAGRGAGQDLRERRPARRSVAGPTGGLASKNLARIGARENPGPTTARDAQIEVLGARKVRIEAIAVEGKSLQVVRALHAAVDHKPRHHPPRQLGGKADQRRLAATIFPETDGDHRGGEGLAVGCLPVLV